MARGITIDPEICSGKPCIAGTRIMVTNVLGMLAGGYTIERIVEAYPELNREDVVAAIEFASRQLEHAASAGG
jgi:uncharacterized protein (DUF433 family)